MSSSSVFCGWQVRPIVEEFAAATGFDRYLLRAKLRLHCGASRDVRASNYSEDWLSQYSSSGYGLVAPAAAHSRNRASASRLDELVSRATPSKVLDRFADDVRAAGLDNGVTVPLRTAHVTGFLNLNSLDIPSWPGVYAVVNLFPISLSDMITRLLVDEQDRLDYDRLTLRERQVLYWALTGKTAWETSVILGISERTVLAHLTNSMAGLGCTNKGQLLGRVASFVDGDPSLSDFRLEL